MNTELLIQQVLTAVIGLCATLLTGLAIYGIGKLQEYLKARLGKENYAAFLVVVRNIVRALEQQGGFFNWTGEDKKEQATLLVHRALASLNLKVPVEYIDIAIEAAVQEMNEAKLLKPGEAGG
jgi:LL-H family phage holin